MKFIYAPKGHEPQTFDENVDDLRGPEIELVEEAGGNQWDTYGEWFDRLTRGGWRAMKVFLWVQLRRTNPTLDIEDLADLTTNELLFVMDDDEVEEGKDESGEAASEPADEPTSSASLTPDSAV